MLKEAARHLQRSFQKTRKLLFEKVFTKRKSTYITCSYWEHYFYRVSRKGYWTNFWSARFLETKQQLKKAQEQGNDMRIKKLIRDINRIHALRKGAIEKEGTVA